MRLMTCDRNKNKKFNPPKYSEMPTLIWIARYRVDTQELQLGNRVSK